MIEQASWFLGCANMAASLVFQAITFHSSKLDVKMKDSLLRAVNVHQLSALGFILLALNKNTKSYWNTTYFWLLTSATCLFPGVIYFQNLFNSGNKIWLSKFVPTGGMMHIAFWFLLASSFSSFNPNQK